MSTFSAGEALIGFDHAFHEKVGQDRGVKRAGPTMISSALRMA